MSDRDLTYDEQLAALRQAGDVEVALTLKVFSRNVARLYGEPVAVAEAAYERLMARPAEPTAVEAVVSALSRELQRQAASGAGTAVWRRTTLATGFVVGLKGDWSLVALAEAVCAMSRHSPDVIPSREPVTVEDVREFLGLPPVL